MYIEIKINADYDVRHYMSEYILDFDIMMCLIRTRLSILSEYLISHLFNVYESVDIVV